MADELKEELEALAVAYLTQNLKEFPNGMALDYFERTFPEKMDETHDWYKKNFKQPSVLAALQSIPNAVKLSYHGNSVFVSLNKASDKVDPHLVGLVIGQKASSKKKRPGARSHSQRVLDSFTLNRSRSGNSGFNTENRFKSKFSSDQRTRSSYGNNISRNNHDQSHWNRSTIYHSRPTRAAPHDPRGAASDHRTAYPDPKVASRETRPTSPWTTSDPRASHNLVPPQIRPMTTAALSSATPSKQPPTSSSIKPSTPSSTSRPHVSTPTTKTPYGTLGDQVKAAIHMDPALERKKLKLRNNLVELLTSKFDALKVFYLASIYKEEYKEDLEPSAYGHKTMTDLLKDPFFKDYIKFIPVFPYNLIKAVTGGTATNGKENLASKEGNSYATSGLTNNAEPLADKSNQISASKIEFNAIDPFNVRTMLQSLEPLKDIKSPQPPKIKYQVEDIVKYRTMRIIFKSPNMMLKLDDWELKYQIEWNSRIRIHIQDYGFKTLLEFFKHLTADIPIKIRLMNDDWVATSDFESVSKWLNEMLAAGKYRAIMAMDKKYDYIAYPGETYPIFDLKSLPRQEYFPVTIMSVNYPHKMWLQFKTPDKIAAHLSIETSLTSYEDYKKKGTFPVPLQFIKVGFPCVVFDEYQQRWCRAAVAEVPEKLDEEASITVFLVDYGVARHVKKSQLQCILKSHLTQSVGLIYAQLHGVSKEFEKMAKMTLQEFTNPPVELSCKVLSSMHTPLDDVDVRWQSRKSIFNVILTDTRLGRDCDLATAINNCTSTADDID
jgi:hypothetical protein